MQTLIAGIVISLGFALHCQPKAAVSAASSDSKASVRLSSHKEARFLVEPVNKKIVVLFGTAADMELHELQQPKNKNEFYYTEGRYDQVGSKYIPLMGLSSSGLGTYDGTLRPPLHFATVRDQASGKTMQCHVHWASSSGFINRSMIMWSGDYLPGMRAAARLYGRRGNYSGKTDEMTAEMQMILPGQSKIHFVFVGYDADGKQIAPFGHAPFQQHIHSLALKDKNKRLK